MAELLPLKMYLFTLLVNGHYVVIYKKIAAHEMSSFLLKYT